MKTKATDALLKDHLLINKILEQFEIDNPRFGKICLTLHRALKAHAWFEDEISQEHRDLDALLGLLRKTPAAHQKELSSYSRQFRVLLSTHFKKEEDALFPITERILTAEGLIELGEEMKRRQMEVRQFLEP